MNLDVYLDRIAYAGPREPTIETLAGVILAHACAIPFENLDVLQGRGISLDEDAIEAKLVRARRGGYCFEQNALLMGALTALGFDASPRSARVRLNAPPDVLPPRTHLFIRVTIDGIPWMADVGVGGLAPTGPIRLDVIDDEQPTPHEPRRIIRLPAGPTPTYLHQAKLGDAWADIHEFTLEEMPAIDREVANWWTSTHARSKFRQNLFAAIARPDGTRASILNRAFTHRRGAEVIEQRRIERVPELLGVLDEWFGVRLPEGTSFGTADAPWPT